MLKNFRVNIVIRTVLIALCALAFAWVLINTSWLFTPLVLGMIFVGLLINLINYVEQTNRNLTQFLATIKQGGFTNLFKHRKGKGSQAVLNEVYNEVLRQFQKITIEKESHYQYLQTLNENLGVSLLSFNKQGVIQLMNPAAKKLLNKPFLKSIDDLRLVNADLYKIINQLESEERQVIKTVLGDMLMQLSVQVKDFVVQGERFRLVLIQNIHHELEEKEVEAWQQLISVLTHEIMNSVTPIASLSTAINQQVEKEGLQLSAEDEEDLRQSLLMIENRSKGLMRFVKAYKEFTKKPSLNISKVDIKQLIDRVIQLLSPDLDQAAISVKLLIDKGDFTLRADKELIEQVLINLIKNAIEVCEGQTEAAIEISMYKTGRKVILEVADNGPGIKTEHLDKIFVPFFTTKKKGTGIGLSFARQIMRLHGGSIMARSAPGEGTKFILSF